MLLWMDRDQKLRDIIFFSCIMHVLLLVGIFLLRAPVPCTTITIHTRRIIPLVAVPRKKNNYASVHKSSQKLLKKTNRITQSKKAPVAAKKNNVSALKKKIISRSLDTTRLRSSLGMSGDVKPKKKILQEIPKQTPRSLDTSVCAPAELRQTLGMSGDVLLADDKKEIIPEEPEISQDISGVEEVYDGYELLYSQLQHEWSLPAGLDEKLSATLCVTLSQHGLLEEVTLETSSSVLVYDMAARAALYKIQYPREMWGKKTMITFDNKT